MGGENLQYLLRKKSKSISIGRSSQNDISIRDLSCSKQHAYMTYVSTSPSSGYYQIVDLSSKHGTYINNRRVRAVNRRDADVDEWIRKAEKTYSTTCLIRKLERKIKRLKKSKNEITADSVEDSILRVNDTLRIGRIECSLISMEYRGLDDDNLTVIRDEEMSLSSNVNTLLKEEGYGEEEKIVHTVRQSENFKHWEQGAHDAKYRVATSIAESSNLRDDEYPHFNDPSVENTEKVYEGLKRDRLDHTIKQGEFIEDLRKKHDMSSKDLSNSRKIRGETIGLELLKKMGWDEKSSLGTSGMRANEPINVVKRSGKAGLGSFRSDNSRVLNVRASAGGLSGPERKKVRNDSARQDGT